MPRLKTPEQLLRTKWYSMVHRDAHRPREMQLVCAEWRDFKTFAADVEFPPNSQAVLCLNDPQHGFRPGNVFWGSQLQRVRHCRHHRLLTHNGRTMSLTEWSDRLGISRPSLAERLERYPVDVALSGRRPARSKRQRVSLRAKRMHVGVFEHDQSVAEFMRGDPKRTRK